MTINSGFETAVKSVLLQAEDWLSVDYISNRTVAQMNGLHYTCEQIVQETQNIKYHSYQDIYEGLQTFMANLYNSNNMEDNNPEFVQAVKQTCELLLGILQSHLRKEVVI